MLLEVGGRGRRDRGQPGRGAGRQPDRRVHRADEHSLADATLLAICLGGISANALNIYSGAMSFVALGIKLPLALRRALVAVVFGVIGFFVA